MKSMLNKANIASLLEPVSNQTTFKAQDSILFQGSTSQKMGFILDGAAVAISYSEDGEETWLGRFEKHEFFGHMSTLTQMPVDFEITAETDLTVLFCNIRDMENLLSRETALNQVLLNDLANRLHTMVNRLIEAYTLSTKGRICAEFIRLSLPVGVDPSKHIIRPNPVFTDIAKRVNSTRETVSRTVSELQKKGIVSRETGAILIHRPEALKSSVR